MEEREVRAVYLHAYDSVDEARQQLASYFAFYKYASYCPISLCA